MRLPFVLKRSITVVPCLICACISSPFHQSYATDVVNPIYIEEMPLQIDCQPTYSSAPAKSNTTKVNRSELYCVAAPAIAGLIIVVVAIIILFAAAVLLTLFKTRCDHKTPTDRLNIDGHPRCGIGWTKPRFPPAKQKPITGIALVELHARDIPVTELHNSVLAELPDSIMRQSEFAASKSWGNVPQVSRTFNSDLGSDENHPAFQLSHNPYNNPLSSSNPATHGSPTYHETAAYRQPLRDHQTRHDTVMSATPLQISGFSEQRAQVGSFTRDIPMPHSASVVSPVQYTNIPSGQIPLLPSQPSMHGRTHHNLSSPVYSNTNQYMHGPVSNTNDYVVNPGKYLLDVGSPQSDTQYWPPTSMTSSLYPNRPSFAANYLTEKPPSPAGPLRSPTEQPGLSNRTLLSSSITPVNPSDVGCVGHW